MLGYLESNVATATTPTEGSVVDRLCLTAAHVALFSASGVQALLAQVRAITPTASLQVPP